MAGPLLAVDAPSMLFRAFYALPESIKGGGDTPINALLGTANLVLREVEQHDPRAVVLCFGPDAADYRVELFDGYHADRPEVPEGLQPQFADSRAFFEAFGWVVHVHDSLEADDLLGSYARREAENGGRALVMTGDRDMYQCATDRVTILYVRTGGRGAEEVDPAEVRKRYGIPPELVPDFIALRGDPSDGIPGAKGIGEKTAADLLSRHGSLEADDLLGSYARREAEAGGSALVMTGDRDMYQCANDRVTVLYIRTGGKGAEAVDADEVRRRYGIDPELVPDFIALRGDPSDGIPGARGIGEKTAADLLQRHGSLDAALDDAVRESKPIVRKALMEQRDELLRFREIATLQEVDVKRPPDRPTDLAGGAAAARERGMNRLAERLEKAASD